MNPTTVVTHTGVGERLKSSCCRIFIGIILFLGSFPLLFWNESRAVQRYDALEEGESQTISVSNSSLLDPANNGKLIRFTATSYNADKTKNVIDSLFGITCGSECLALQRHSQMYQWREMSESNTETNLGGSQTTTTTYTYEKTWSSSLINSNSFQDSSQHTNPSTMDYPSQDFLSTKIMAGAYELPTNIVNWLLSVESPMNVQVNDITDTGLRNLATSITSGVPETGFFFGTGMNTQPKVGDDRVWFTKTDPATITVVGVQTDTTVKAFVSENGNDVLLYAKGNLTSAEMYDIAENQNYILTWVLRFVGFAVMALGQVLIWSLLMVAADVIPCVGSIVGCGVYFISITIAAILSSITISIAWLIVHPVIGGIVLGSCLVVIGLCACGAKMLFGRKDDDDVEVSKPEKADIEAVVDVEGGGGDDGFNNNLSDLPVAYAEQADDFEDIEEYKPK